MFNKVIWGFVMISLGVGILSGNMLFAADDEEIKIVDGMKQGEFATLLVKQLGAEGRLPLAATYKDAFKFLEKLGVIPPNGWDSEGTVDQETLIYMLGVNEEEAAGATFDELLEKLTQRLSDILATMGIHTVAPQTVSPAGG